MRKIPRIEAKKKEYKLKDFKKWVKIKMVEKNRTQGDVAKVLDLSQGRLSQMLKVPDPKKDKGKKEEKDPFSYGQVLILCDFFDVDSDEKARLLTL